MPKTPKLPHPFHTNRALGERLRIAEPEALEYVIGVLKEHGGNMGATASALGVGERTLYKWRDANPRTAKAFAQHTLGREGAAACATNARAHVAPKTTPKRRRAAPRVTA